MGKNKRPQARALKLNLPPAVEKEEKELAELEALFGTDPAAATTTLARFAMSTGEPDRRTAAVCIDLLMTARREEALRLWGLLLADPEPLVRDTAHEMLVGAYEMGEDYLEPNGIQLSQQEAYDLAWRYYTASQQHTGKEIGEPISDMSQTPGNDVSPMTGTDRQRDGHDALLVKHLLGLVGPDRPYRQRFHATCAAGGVTPRYLKKHRDRLVWVLAQHLHTQIAGEH